MPEVLPSEHLLDLSSFWFTGTLTAITSPDVMSRMHCNLCYFGDIQLVWHLTELSMRETSQTPLDVKLANRNEVMRGKRLLIGCGGGVQQACSSAIQFLVDSNCPWHSCLI